MRFYYLVFLLFVIQPGHSQQWEQVINLRGTWKFEIGDNLKWADTHFDDHSWTNIHVPDSWENEGFPGYDGYAWYRRNFIIPTSESESELYLRLGYIDDVDEVYFNGTLIGFTGSFPPDYRTAYNEPRTYVLPTSLINFGKENVLAIRVFDEQLEGGILRGDIGVYKQRNQMELAMNLSGEWKFRTGDNFSWKDEDINDSHWNTILVPGFWETQGYRDYDGFAWYRKEFILPKDLENKKLILVLGKIDDIDECYFNGTKIGATGRMRDNPEEIRFSDEYQEFRAYYLPASDLRFGSKNTIAVRVYDGFIDGGIYQGPIGITTREKYLDWKNTQSRDTFNIFEKLFGK